MRPACLAPGPVPRAGVLAPPAAMADEREDLTYEAFGTAARELAEP
jgi:hypothetical protein